MASLTWSLSILAGAVARPLDGWQYEYVPFGGMIKINHDTTAIGILSTITSGSDTLQERSPLSAGGAAGVIPSDFDTPSIMDEVASGDRIKILYENTTAGTLVVTGTIDYNPA